MILGLKPSKASPHAVSLVERHFWIPKREKKRLQPQGNFWLITIAELSKLIFVQGDMHEGLNVSKSIGYRLMTVVNLSHQYYDMAFLQIPHSALPEKNSKDPPSALMEYLLMTDEMMDPTSFLDEESSGVCESLSWGQWQTTGDQTTGKKRKQMDEAESHHLPAGLAKSVNIAQDKTSQPTKLQRHEQCK
ncbi:hypothetical protein J6590_026940 [Homalodisca vitripennis]|nr:hypothetical protein J6590_026940 [Homalodisca vitripennis]